MVDLDTLRRVVLGTSEQHLHHLAISLNQENAECAKQGALDNSRRCISIGAICSEKGRELAEAVAGVIAEACGPEGVEHVGLLEAALSDARGKVIKHYLCSSGANADAFSMHRTAQKHAEAVTKELDAHFRLVVDEFQLGMVKGMSIKSAETGSITINKSPGTTVASQSVAAQVGDDNTLTQTVKWDSETLIVAVQAFRDGLAEAALDAELRDKLDDAAVSLQHEARDENRDLNRLQRLAGTFKSLCEQVAIGTVSSSLADKLSAILDALAGLATSMAR